MRSRDWDDPDGVIWDDVTENGETLHKALANVDYPKYFEKTDRMRLALFESSLKTNDALEFAVITGRGDQPVLFPKDIKAKTCCVSKQRI